MAKPHSKKKRSRKGDEDHRILGVTRKQRYRIYLWGAVLVVLAFLVWSIGFLRPATWYKYTDQVAFEQEARKVNPGFVVWEKAEKMTDGFEATAETGQPVISSDGARMVYCAGEKDGNRNLFLRLWDGRNWGEPRPMRALNSVFHEKAPALSGDGGFLYFASDRPGGRGGFDIWVAKWDGAEYAWPLPLTNQVNTPFDEIDPAPSPDNLALYFASNQPRREAGAAGSPVATMLPGENVEGTKSDFDLYVADVAGDTPFDLIVERQLSMLYSLRESALKDMAVMEKLGGSQQSESAVDRSLAYLAATQEEDGRWDIAKHGGQGGHDVAATASALLAFYGRGQTHDKECKYRDTVKRGIDWLASVQNAATGDLRGPKPASNGMYDHGIAALAMVEAYGVTKDPQLRPKAQAALDFIIDSQHEEGGWRYKPGDKGDLSVSGWMIMALASGKMSGLRVPDKTMESASTFVKSLSSGQSGGSYGYTDKGKGTPSMNAVGFFCSQLFGHSSNAPKAFESAGLIGKQGFNAADVYYAYYGTLCAYQHQGPLWRAWLKEMHPQFIKAQAGDGSWDISGGHSKGMGRVISTALITLCLEAHYRYTPLYGLGFEPDESGPSAAGIDENKLPATPHFRHAKHLATLNSPADDTGPVVTDHGDFLYFSSRRLGGEGGADLYRSRISGPEPTAPRNLGPEVNSKGNETHPAIRHAGFQLIFNSDRDQDSNALYSARSKRMVRRFDLSKMPSGAWITANIGWLIGLFAALAVFLWLAKRALRHPGAAADTPVLPDNPRSDSAI